MHALLIVNGFFHSASTDRVLGSQLVHVYVSFGCLRDALLVFDKLPQKSNIAWNAVLRGFLDVGQFSKMIEFYNLMLSHGLTPDNFTYPLVLKACSGLNDLEQGRKLRDMILLNVTYHPNPRPNVFVGCAMIDMFAKCGSLKEARQVFDGMPERDLASWSAIICGTIQREQWFEALSLFREMRKEGIRPDSVIVAAVLPACGRLELKQIGMALQGCAVSIGFESDLFVSNALIDMYCKCGDVDNARIVFQNVTYKDVVSWSSLIAGYSKNCLYKKSCELYIKMNKTGMGTNVITAASVLPGLGKLKLLKQGKEMHSYVLKQDFVSDVVVRSSLIDMYANCGSIREAEFILEEMDVMDITLLNSMMAGYSLNGDIDSALGIFRRIWDFCLRPNSITLLSILPICTRLGHLRHGKETHGFATRSCLVTVVSIGNSLIDMYCKCGYLELGVNVFNHMLEKNIVSYNIIISGHGIFGLGERIFSFFKQMKDAGIRPNKITFIALLTACSHAGLVDKGWLLYNSMIYDYNFLPDKEHYSCMVDLLSRAGFLDDACRFLRRIPVEASIDILGSLLGACRVHKNMALAEFAAEQILQKNEIDSGYYVLLSNIYAAAGKWKEALKFRTLIKEKGLVKEPGSSWIQLGSCIHKFHAGDKINPEFDRIQEILESLFFESKNKGFMADLSFLHP